MFQNTAFFQVSPASSSMAPASSLAAFINDQNSLTDLRRDRFITTNDKCPICLLNTTKPIIETQCRHIFHHDCLLVWLKQQRDDHCPGTCPCCRRVFFTARPRLLFHVPQLVSHHTSPSSRALDQINHYLEELGHRGTRPAREGVNLTAAMVQALNRPGDTGFVTRTADPIDLAQTVRHYIETYERYWDDLFADQPRR
jgi:hypothetical protein